MWCVRCKCKTFELFAGPVPSLPSLPCAVWAFFPPVLLSSISDSNCRLRNSERRHGLLETPECFIHFLPGQTKYEKIEIFIFTCWLGHSSRGGGPGYSKSNTGSLDKSFFKIKNKSIIPGCVSHYICRVGGSGEVCPPEPGELFLSQATENWFHCNRETTFIFIQSLLVKDCMAQANHFYSHSWVWHGNNSQNSQASWWQCRVFLQTKSMSQIKRLHQNTCFLKI